MKRLIILACAVALGACATSGQPDFREYDIAAMQELMQRGAVTSRELVQYYLDRIDAIDRRGPELFAIIELNPDALQIAGELDEERRRSRARSLMPGSKPVRRRVTPWPPT